MEKLGQKEQLMITVTNLSLNFSGTNLFSGVNLKFTPETVMESSGANGAGKSTFLRILSGDLDSTTGDVHIQEGARMSVLKQDHFAYNDFTVLDTIVMGNPRLAEITKEKDALYASLIFSRGRRHPALASSRRNSQSSTDGG